MTNQTTREVREYATLMQMIDGSRAAHCHRCDVRGVHVDTDAGEIVIKGSPYYVGDYTDLPWLLCGRADGSDIQHVYCDDCADDDEE